ncbi:hypothetical protein ACHAPF_006619 [Botrytis cinerea]
MVVELDAVVCNGPPMDLEVILERFEELMWNFLARHGSVRSDHATRQASGKSTLNTALLSLSTCLEMFAIWQQLANDMW